VSSVITILIHPSPLYSEGLGRLLHGTPFQPLHTARTPDNLPQALLEKEGLLFIVGGGDPVHVADMVTAISRRFIAPRIIVIAEKVECKAVMPALEGGAHGYLGDNLSSAALVKSLELVMLGETVLPTEFVRRLPAQVAHALDASMPSVENTQIDASNGAHMLLSDRELSILRKLASGSSNKVIANDLCITEATVKVHVKSILRKIRAKNRTQAAIWAVTKAVHAEP
jgi:two-component system nitrate/nitrite response regulator NarL